MMNYNLCRICRITGDSNSLNDMMISGLLEVYSFCTNIPISEDNEKCYKICGECKDLLVRFNDFKKLCIESENYFKHNVFQTEIKLEYTNDPLQSTSSEKIVIDADPSINDVKCDYESDDHFLDNDNVDHNNENKNVATGKKRSGLSEHNCKFCLKKFVYIASLKKHYLKCKKVVKKDDKSNTDTQISKEDVKKEIDSLDKFVCSTCNKEFSKEKPYLIHLRTHTGEKPFECLYCGKKYADATSFRTHTQKVHLKTTEYACHICPKTFFTKYDLRRHLYRHAKRFECNLCCKKFTLKTSLVKHLENHSTKCHICSEEFSNTTDYRNHILTHMEDDPYKCKICEIDFIYLNSFKQHVKENHPGKPIEDCIENPQQLIPPHDTPNEAIPNRIAPPKRKSPPPESEKKFICNFCGKRFMANCILDEHIRVHTGEKPFACDKCDFKCRNKSQLKFHKQHRHEKMPKYSCSICSYQAYTSHRLTRHMISHFDEKPFVCEVCDAAFKSSRSLIVHKRSHTGEKPYECTYCSKAFASSSYLKDHLPVHTGEKRFTCKICDKRFSQRAPLTKHMEFHKNGNGSIKF